jgi:hypothetical protein
MARGVKGYLRLVMVRASRRLPQGGALQRTRVSAVAPLIPVDPVHATKSASAVLIKQPHG